MLTKSDELLCHQIVSTFDHVETGERNWAEKMLLDVYDSSGQIYLSHGIGKYTNRNVMDGFCCMGLPGRQYNVRASRELQPDVDTVAIGPVSYEVIEPLKKVRICLDENDYGISYDIELDGVMPPFEEPAGFTRFKGALVNHHVRYYQLCRPSGKITVEGKSYDVKKDTWYAQRDHSWGVRAMMGAYRAAGGWRHPEDTGMPEAGLQPNPRHQIPGYLGFTNVVEFRDFGYFTTYVEGPDGVPFQIGMSGLHGFVVYPFENSRPPQEILSQQFEIEMVPGTRHLKSVEADLALEDGSTLHISMKPVGVGAYLFPGGYFGGYKDWWHGKWMGPSWMDGEKLDLTDPKVIDMMFAGGLWNTILECKYGEEVGYASIQYGAWGDLPKYGLKALSPA